MADKLYVVTREDLPPGAQAVQSCHAARQFAHEHPELEQHWFGSSNHLAFLSTSNEMSLIRLMEKADRSGIAFSIFREPDLGNCITAIAFEPGLRGRKLCSGLRLTLRDEASKPECV